MKLCARDTENENEAQNNLEENRTESRRQQTEEKRYATILVF